MADITIREATPTDFAEVAGMHYSVWRQSWSGVLADQVLDELYIAQASQRHGVGALLLAKALNSEKNDFHLDGRTLDWEPMPGVKVPHLGYRLRRR